MKHPVYAIAKAEIKRKGNGIEISKDGESRSLPLSMIGQMWLFGKVRMSDGTRNFLLQNGVQILYLSRSGTLYGILDASRLLSNHTVRLAQYRAFEFRRIETAKFFVSQKLSAIDEATTYPYESFKRKLQDAQTLEELLGVEGAATVYFFDDLKNRLHRHGIPFEKRSYRPPEDAVNGLLSFVYTLHYGWFYSLLMGEGYDPYIGYLHHKRGRHAPLASDMMEAMRVDLSLFVVECFATKIVEPSDFDERYRLKSDKIRPLISAYAKRFIHDESIRTRHRNLLHSFKELLSCR